MSANQLTSKELALRDRLLAGNATHDEGMRLYSSMTERGLTFPTAWEELVLGLGLRAQPDRLDLKARFRHVLTMQGKPVSGITSEMQLSTTPRLAWQTWT
jgi:hypothetical protein